MSGSTTRRVAFGCALLVAVGLLWWFRGTDGTARGGATPSRSADAPPEHGATGPHAPRPLESRSELAAAPAVAKSERVVARTDASKPCSVSGIVTFEPGIVGGPVTLALFPLRDGLPEREAADRITVAAGERYCLRGSIDGPHALVAIARGGPESSDELLRPATATADLWPGAAVELEPLVLGWGESLAGQVVRSDGEAISDARVSAHPLGTARGPTLVDLAHFSWVDERFELAAVHGRFPGGAFLIRGLAPLRYSVTGRDEDVGSEGVGMMPIHVRDVHVEVAASATGVVVPTGEFARVRFRVTGSGRPLQAVFEFLGEGGITGTSTDPEGLLDLLVDPAQRYVVRFSHVEHMSRQLEFAPHTLMPGAIIDVELQPGPPVASLEIVLAESVAEVLGLLPIDLEIYPADVARQLPERIEEWPVRMRGGMGTVQLMGQLSRPELVRDGQRLSIPALPPGPYLVRVIPRVVDDTGLPCSMWLAERFELELAPGERAERVVQPVLGGRVRLDVRGAPATGNVEFKIEGPAAASITSQFLWPGQGGVRGGMAPRIPGFSHLVQPLAPGNCAVHVRSGEARLRSVSFAIEAGATTDVVVDLTGL